jgi:hypothetical protein
MRWQAFAKMVLDAIPDYIDVVEPSGRLSLGSLNLACRCFSARRTHPGA